ncbi:hypothetical protein ACFX11_003496 [Malus domestica]
MLLCLGCFWIKFKKIKPKLKEVPLKSDDLEDPGCNYPKKKMEPDHGKLFIGGISWDTDEERLKEYFGKYGKVVEAVIMRYRVTSRARGFGVVVFADPAVAERVVMDKHMIDCRTVIVKSCTKNL